MNQTIPERILAFNSGREKRTIQVKYTAMAGDPFRFLRGTCHLFYEDLLKDYPFGPSPDTWICGDLHIENFGSFKGADRLVYFDLNDFDEALQAPLLWEIARLVTAAGLAAEVVGFSPKERKQLPSLLLEQYRQTLVKQKSSIVQEETARGLIKKMMDKVTARKTKELIRQRTDNKEKGAKLLVNERLLALPAKEKKPLIAAFEKWLAERHRDGYRVTDTGIRIAGTGSIGVKRWVMLLEQRKDPAKKLLIDVKQAVPATPGLYGKAASTAWENDAARVIGVQEIMQQVTPAFLSVFHYEGAWFVVKEMQPMEDKVSIANAIKQPQHVESYYADLATLTASAQLRGSGRRGAANADALAEFATPEAWTRTLLEWCSAYTDQVKKDYAAYVEAWKDGYFKQ